MPEIFDPTGKKVGEIREEKNLIGEKHYDIYDTTGNKVGDIRNVGETERIVAEKAVSVAGTVLGNPGCLALLAIALVVSCSIGGFYQVFFANWGATRFWGPVITVEGLTDNSLGILRISPDDIDPITKKYTLRVQIEQRSPLLSFLNRGWDIWTVHYYANGEKRLQQPKDKSVIKSSTDGQAEYVQQIPVSCSDFGKQPQTWVLRAVDNGTTVAVKRIQVYLIGC